MSFRSFIPSGQSQTTLEGDRRHKWLQLPLLVWQGCGVMRLAVTEVICILSASSGISSVIFLMMRLEVLSAQYNFFELRFTQKMNLCRDVSETGEACKEPKTWRSSPLKVKIEQLKKN